MSENVNRIQGKIIRIVKERGFAFAEGVTDKVDYFVHMKQVRKDSVAFRHFNVGDILEFTPVIVDGSKAQAHDVKHCGAEVALDKVVTH